MRFALVQFDIVWEDKPANHAIIERMLAEADIQPGTFVLLPELGDTGFSMNLDRIVDDRSLIWAQNLAQRFGIYVQAGYARRESAHHSENQHYQHDHAHLQGRNCAAVIAPDGAVLGEYQKVHPFSYGKEADHYGGGDHLLLVHCGDAIIAPLICYDLRFPELWRLAMLNGAEIFTIGASWPAARQHHWRALAIARAIENQAYVIAANRTGSDPLLRYAGGSIIVSPKGEVLAEGSDEPAVLTAELDLAALRDWRTHFPALRDVKRNLLGDFKIHTSGIQEASGSKHMRPIPNA